MARKEENSYGKDHRIRTMKGGVGKSVSTFNLAYSLEELGKKVLAVDFDSQANLTTCMGVEDVAAVPVFTIVAEADGEGATKWGKLKSGTGWISLDFGKKI